MDIMTAPCPPEFIALAERLADAAAEVIMRHFRRDLGIDDKTDETPVTVADRDAEAAMRSLIADSFPGHGIIGEEHGADRPDAEFVWVLDPIDGTKAFISGIPVFGTLIALLRAGRPILGLVNQPMTRERWIGAAGRRTTMNGEAVGAAPRGALSEAVLWSTSPEMFDHDPTDRAAYNRLLSRVKFVHYGGECYQYAMLASGFVDLVVEADLGAYDFMAHIPIIEGAGGVVTDWLGRPLGLESDGRVLAAAGAALHAEALEMLT